MAAEGAGALMSEIDRACESFNRVFESCEGCFIDAVIFNADGDSDYLELRLIQTQKWELATVLLERVRYFNIDKGPEIGGSFVDEIKVTHLPAGNLPWPAEAESLVVRFDGLPDLYWVQVIGPTPISGISQIMTVSTSQDVT